MYLIKSRRFFCALLLSNSRENKIRKIGVFTQRIRQMENNKIFKRSASKHFEQRRI